MKLYITFFFFILGVTEETVAEEGAADDNFDLELDFSKSKKKKKKKKELDELMAEAEEKADDKENGKAYFSNF